MEHSPGCDIHFAFPGLQNGDGDASRRSESKKADSFAGLDASDTQAAKSDDAGAEQRSDVHVVQGARQRKREVRTRESVFGVAAVYRVTREDRLIAQVFHRVAAIPAIAIHAAHPGNSHARSDWRFLTLACDDFADDLVTRNQLRPKRRQVTFDDVQIRATHATGEDAKQQMSRDKLRARNIFDN